MKAIKVNKIKIEKGRAGEDEQQDDGDFHNLAAAVWNKVSFCARNKLPETFNLPFRYAV